MKNFNEFCKSYNADIIAKDIAFWQKLSHLANISSQDLSNILGVPVSNIRTWKNNIDSSIKEIEENRAQNKKNEMIKTGTYEK